jgi:sec-independent protein translocase protein TatA
MGSLGLPEIIFILLLALLIFGPKRLPEIGRTLGKGMAEFRKASNDLKRTINAELALDEDEQTRHPRRIESPVPSIVQAMTPLTASTVAPAAVESVASLEPPALGSPVLESPARESPARESPVMESPAPHSFDPTSPEPPTYHELPVAQAPWSPPQGPPPGTVAQGSHITPIVPVVTPASSPADLNEAAVHAPVSTGPIEPS